MNYSKQIESFLNFLREAETNYHIALSEQISKNNETQDLLHRLELDDDGYHDSAKIAKVLRQVRQERRSAKDMETVTEPIVLYLENNKKTINCLERLLGDVRKAEKSIENRFYINRTDIVESTLTEVYND